MFLFLIKFFLWVVKERSFALSMLFADSTENFDQKQSTQSPLLKLFCSEMCPFSYFPKVNFSTSLHSSINNLEILKDINADTP